MPEVIPLPLAEQVYPTGCEFGSHVSPYKLGLRVESCFTEPLLFSSTMSLSDENMDLMRPWTISEDDLFDEIVENGYVESSSAWRQFQPFFASCGYEICFHGLTDAKVPLVDLIKNSDNPFKPCADGPFVYHNPCGFDPSLGTYWKSWRIMVCQDFSSISLII